MKQLCMEKHVSVLFNKRDYLLWWTLLDAACPVDNVVISVPYSKLKYNTICCDFWLLTIHLGNMYCMPVHQAFFKVLGIHQRIRDISLFWQSFHSSGWNNKKLIYQYGNDKYEGNESRAVSKHVPITVTLL